MSNWICLIPMYRSYPRVLKSHYETPCEKSLTTCSGVRHFNFPGAADATIHSSFSNGNSLVNKTWIRRIYCFNSKINVKSKISKAIIKSHSLTIYKILFLVYLQLLVCIFVVSEISLYIEVHCSPYFPFRSMKQGQRGKNIYQYIPTRWIA